MMIEFGELIIFNDFDQAFSVFRVCCIAGFLQTFRPSFVICNVETEKKPVTLTVFQKIRMIIIGFKNGFIFPETFITLVIILCKSWTCPVGAFNSEMIVR